jgi:hypothetical protein
MAHGKGISTDVADSIPFDNDTNGFVAEDVQAAIEEAGDAASASPGFSFGRSGNIPKNTWLSNETVPSNKAGRFVYINNAVITRVFLSSEDVDTYDVQVYHHLGDEVNLTLVGTVSVVSARGDTFPVNWAVPTGTQLAIKVSDGSAKNLIAGLQLSGSS